MERITNFSPAYDRRDPNPNKNYGIHGVTLRMVLKGELGAVQFLLYTNWHLPHVQKELDAERIVDGGRLHILCHPMPVDLGYHSPKPTYEDQEPTSSEPCEYLDGKPCYYDGSGLNAQRIYDVLVKYGSDAVWTELEIYYTQIFGELK